MFANVSISMIVLVTVVLNSHSLNRLNQRQVSSISGIIGPVSWVM